ncbi:MAG: hypothetical protein HY075_12190 [Deltaproteobacteria bacterium]|nr:hypothetical protein [Deltaproteobacteria bacterium]
MRQIILAVMVTALGVSFASDAQARKKVGRKIASVSTSEAAVPSLLATRGGDPCKSDFELKVVVTATEGEDTWPVGVRLSYKSKTGRGLASRTHTTESAAFDAARCERWRKRSWALLERILYENKRAERRKVVCRNVASISYRVGVKDTASTDVCLGYAKDDAVAYAFNQFWLASDGMAE